MSLRFFHLFFIAIASLMAFGCACIEYSNYGVQQSSLHLAGMIGAVIAGVALMVYGAVFYKKSKNLTS
ncbi:MAG: hypothetical protein WCH43_04360 [Verrucomicrobiota bacterium]